MQYSSFFCGVFVFPFQFFAITLVLVWCVFLRLCESNVSSVDHVLFWNCAVGEASFSHVLRCWFCCSLHFLCLFPLNSVVDGGFQEV